MSRILIPEYLLNFARDIYEGPLPSNFGERLIEAKYAKVLENWYKLFGGKIPANQGKKMVPNYLLLFIQNLVNAEILEVVDDDVAYIKETPQNALKYAFINKVGGMSYKADNLSVGTLNANINSSGILEPSVAYKMLIIEAKNGKTYYLQNNSVNQVVIGYFSSMPTIGSQAVNNERIVIEDTSSFTATSNNYVVVRFDISDTNASVVDFIGIRDSLVTSVNDTVLTANEDKYGWGINEDYYNYRDYDENKGHVVIKRVDLGSLNYEKIGTGNNTRFVYTLSDVKPPATNDDLVNITTTTSFVYKSANSAWNDKSGFSINVEKLISFYTQDYSTAEAFKTAMNGVYLYYELATEVTEDIDPIDNVIDVSNNLTFNNEYEQDVPSEITYYVRS